MRSLRSAAAVALAAAVLSSAGATAQSVDRPTVSWTPANPAEGELFVVRVETPPDNGFTLVEGHAGAEALHFEQDSDRSFVSMAAVPLGERAELWVSLALVHPDGREQQVNARVPVTPGTYNHRQLRVAPELGSPPSSAQRARRARESAMAREVSDAAHTTPRLWTGGIVMPRGSAVTSSFGDGRVFNGQVSSRHTGLDLRGAPGDTVVAPTRGVVALAEQFELAGNNVYINHGAGLVSAYFHLTEQLVSPGDTVVAGTPIGRVGATGRVTGPHLHWVVRYGRTSVDPRSLLSVAGEIASVE